MKLKTLMNINYILIGVIIGEFILMILKKWYL